MVFLDSNRPKRPIELRADIEELEESRASWERRAVDLPPLLAHAEGAENEHREAIRRLRDEMARIRLLPKTSLTIGEDGRPRPSVDVDAVDRYHRCELRIAELEEKYDAWVNEPTALRLGGDRFGHEIVWSIRRPSDIREQMAVVPLKLAACDRALAAARAELDAAM